MARQPDQCGFGGERTGWCSGGATAMDERLIIWGGLKPIPGLSEPEWAVARAVMARRRKRPRDLLDVCLNRPASRWALGHGNSFQIDLADAD